jgi:NAD(P)-dependent dehydrogenase (short-subunit alcohol dehydrogenase family)
LAREGAKVLADLNLDAAFEGVPYISYAVTKAGVIQFTRVIALQHPDRHPREYDPAG